MSRKRIYLAALIALPLLTASCVLVDGDVVGVGSRCQHIAMSVPYRRDLPVDAIMDLVAWIEDNDPNRSCDSRPEQISWRSSDYRIATVDSYGRVRGEYPGYVRITATNVRSGRSTWVDLTVTWR
jgi:hypothetical protein